MRTLLLVLMGLVLAVIVLVVLGVTVSRTARFHEYLRGVVVRQAAQYLNGTLAIGRIQGSLFSDIELDQVTLVHEGIPTVSVEKIVLRYDLRTIYREGLVLNTLALTKPVIALEHGPAGWNFSRFVKTRKPNGQRPSVTLQDIQIADGHVELRERGGVPYIFNNLDARLRFSTSPDQIAVTIGSLASRLDPSKITLRNVSGAAYFHEDNVQVDNFKIATDRSQVSGHMNLRGYRTKGVMDATIDGEPLSVPELSRFLPWLSDVTFEPRLTATAQGPLDNLNVNFAMDSAAGRARGPLVMDLSGPARDIRGTLDTDHVNLAGIFKVIHDRTDITGHSRFDMALPRSPGTSLAVSFQFSGPEVQAFGYRVTAAQANGSYENRIVKAEGQGNAYGGSARVQGVFRFPPAPDTFSYVTSGSFNNVNLTSLPSTVPTPRLDSRLAGNFQLEGHRGGWSGSVDLNDSVAEGTKLSSGTTGRIAVQGPSIAYEASGRATDVDVERWGRALQVSVMQENRFRSLLNGDFSMRGSGRTLDELMLDVNATLMDSAALGGRLPELNVNLQMASRRLTTALRGSFEGIDPSGFVPQTPADTALTGTTDATAVVARVGGDWTPDAIEATGQFSLTKSTLGGVVIDTADVGGAYLDRVARLNRFAVNGPDLTATASGVLALDDRTSSNLQYDATASTLTLVAKLIDQPVSGAAHVSGTITGPAAQMTSAGTLLANRVQYGDHVDLLSLNSSFTATMPDLDWQRANGHADSMAAFARISGVEFTEVTAHTDYNARELQFRTSFAQQQRAVQADGLVQFQPDYHELHLRSLSLGIGQTTWTLPAGQEARVRYGDDAVTINGLELRRAEQRLAVDGTFFLGGEAAAPITASDVEVRAERLQVKDLNDLMLGSRQVAGLLDGTGHITGTAAAPRVNGTFSLTNGQVQGVPFEALSGKVDYQQRQVSLDVQLRQSAAASLTAAGIVPLSLFRASSGAIPDDPIDLHVESTSINVGLFQPLAPSVENLRGQLQVNLHATGTARTPRVDGNFDLTDGAFLVPATGADYTRLDARFRFAGDNIVVEHLQVFDGDGHALTAEGALSIQERRIANLDVHASGSRFLVLNNQYGHVELDMLLRATGEALRPTIEGNIETRAGGRLQIDRLLEEFSSRPYRTDTGTAAAAAPSASWLNSMSLALQVHVLDDLVLRGSNIRAQFAPIALGDINITVGGNLDVKKAPNERPKVIGNVAVVRGLYNFQGRRFDVLRDSLIRFDGVDVFDPSLRITAQRNISGVIAQVHLTGTVSAPELTLSSQPPLDEADILSLIVFNAPVNELGTNERISLAERAGTLAAGYVTTPLANSIAQALNLDVVEIQAASDYGGGPSVSIGQQVGSRLFVGFRQEFGPEDISELSFEYRLTELLRLVTTIAQGARRTHRMQRVESSAADLILAISY